MRLVVSLRNATVSTYVRNKLLSVYVVSFRRFITSKGCNDICKSSDFIFYFAEVVFRIGFCCNMYTHYSNIIIIF